MALLYGVFSFQLSYRPLDGRLHARIKVVLRQDQARLNLAVGDSAQQPSRLFPNLCGSTALLTRSTYLSMATTSGSSILRRGRGLSNEIYRHRIPLGEVKLVTKLDARSFGIAHPRCVLESILSRGSVPSHESGQKSCSSSGGLFSTSFSGPRPPVNPNRDSVRYGYTYAV